MLPKYSRVLLKLSGESLMGDRNFGIDPKMLEQYAKEIKMITNIGVQVAIVIGGGNIYRGMNEAETGIERAQGDYMGMLATVINGMALQAALEAKLDLPADFGLIGVGNHRYGRFLKVPLSTVDQQRSQIGHLAAELLLASMDKKRLRPKAILTEPKLVVRDSSNRTGVSDILPATDGARRNAKQLAKR